MNAPPPAAGHSVAAVVLFITLAGTAQGLAATLALAELAALPMRTSFLADALALAVALLGAALAASAFPLGRPARAWRAPRGIWRSRELVVLPAFIAACAGWWLALRQGWDLPWLPFAVLLLAAALWLCTAMVHASVRSIPEWAQPLTLLNFTLTGLSCGLVLACALAALGGQLALLLHAAPLALGVTLAAAPARLASMLRGARLRQRTATPAAGIQADWPKRGVIVPAFVLPALLLAWGLAGTSPILPWLLAPVLQLPGVLAERWCFLASARQPQQQAKT